MPLTDEQRKAASERMKAMHEAKRTEIEQSQAPARPIRETEIDRAFTTNGYVLMPGKVTTTSLKETVKSTDENGNVRDMTDDETDAVFDDIVRRQKEYNLYMRGISEKHEYMHDSGTTAVGSSD